MYWESFESLDVPHPPPYKKAFLKKNNDKSLCQLIVVIKSKCSKDNQIKITFLN